MLVNTSVVAFMQDNADIEWKFARAVIIRDIWTCPPIPIPINIFHFVALIVSHVCCTSCKVMACVVDGRLARLTYLMSSFSLAFF